MNTSTLLYRQINPSWVQGDNVTSQAFKPTPKDNKKLSVYDSDIVNAEASWRHFTEAQGLSSVGVLAVSVAECDEQALPVVPDPNTFPAHALIDFSKESGSSTERKAKVLRTKAMSRGWQYRADSAAPRSN